MTAPEPLDLAAIREADANVTYVYGGILCTAERHRRALLAEVDRLTGERDQARAAVEPLRQAYLAWQGAPPDEDDVERSNVWVAAYTLAAIPEADG